MPVPHHSDFYRPDVLSAPPLSPTNSIKALKACVKVKVLYYVIKDKNIVIQ